MMEFKGTVEFLQGQLEVRKEYEGYEDLRREFALASLYRLIDKQADRVRLSVMTHFLYELDQFSNKEAQ